jgi:toxin ParE1/3/4
MARAIRSTQADIDLLAIFTDVIRRRSDRSMTRLAAAIHRKSQHYASLPLTGILRDDLAGDLRCFPVQAYLVFYRPNRNGIELIRVFHHAQDIRPEMFAS